MASTLNLANDQARQAFAGLDDTFGRGLFADIADQVQRMLRFETHEVAARDHAKQFAVRRNRQVMNVILHHHEGRLVGIARRCRA